MDFNNINKSMNNTKDLLKNTATKISNKKSEILNNIKSSIPISNIDNLQTIDQNSIINQNNNNSNNITFLTVIKDFFISKLIIIKDFLFNFIYSYKITITILILLFIFSDILYKKVINFYINTLDNVNNIIEKNEELLNNSNKIIDNITNTPKQNNNTLETKLKSSVVTNENVNDIVSEDLNNEREEILEENLVKNLNTESESKPITKIKHENDNTFDIDKLNLTKSNNNTNTGNEGWCYIGTSNNIRTCARVGKNNQCLSGEIFPSLDICRDPTLRE